MSVFAGKVQIICANTQELWRESVKLQREIYCRERGYEAWPKNPNPDQFDEYDESQTRRFVMTANDRVFATARVIMKGRFELPVKRLQPRAVVFDSHVRYIEGSGFCCSKELKRKLGLNTSEASRHITMSLLASVVSVGGELGIDCAAMAVEPVFLRYMKALGLVLHKVGEPVNYHGCRQVCVGSMFGEMLPGVLKKNKKLWDEAVKSFSFENVLNSNRINLRRAS